MLSDISQLLLMSLQVGIPILSAVPRYFFSGNHDFRVVWIAALVMGDASIIACLPHSGLSLQTVVFLKFYISVLELLTHAVPSSRQSARQLLAQGVSDKTKTGQLEILKDSSGSKTVNSLSQVTSKARSTCTTDLPCKSMFKPPPCHIVQR